MSKKYNPEQLRAMALIVKTAKAQGDPRYEVLVLMLCMKFMSTRHEVEAQIERLAQ